jgi:hypothetical protein
MSPTGWTASVVARLFPDGPEAARRGVAWLNDHLGSLVALGMPIGTEYVVDGGSAILSIPNHAQGSPWRLSPPVVHGLHDLVIRLGKIEGGQSQSLSATLGGEVLSCLVGFPIILRRKGMMMTVVAVEKPPSRCERVDTLLSLRVRAVMLDRVMTTTAVTVFVRPGGHGRNRGSGQFETGMYWVTLRPLGGTGAVTLMASLNNTGRETEASIPGSLKHSQLARVFPAIVRLGATKPAMATVKQLVTGRSQQLVSGRVVGTSPCPLIEDRVIVRRRYKDDPKVFVDDGRPTLAYTYNRARRSWAKS